jgi:radical SAM protein with 4Fe4S-binding SPASM domain
LTEDVAEKLFKSGLDKLLISMDSIDKELYEEIRFGARYDVVMNNIKKAVEIRNAMNAYGTLIRVGMVVTDKTVSQQVAFKDYFSKIVDVVSFNQVHEEIKINDNDFPSGNARKHKFTDSQLWQRMTINWNGDAEICCENYKQEYKLGNVLSQSVEEIWNGDAFNKARQIHLAGEWWKIPQCRKCTIPYIGRSCKN